MYILQYIQCNDTINMILCHRNECASEEKKRIVILSTEFARTSRSKRLTSSRWCSMWRAAFETVCSFRWRTNSCTRVLFIFFYCHSSAVPSYFSWKASEPNRWTLRIRTLILLTSLKGSIRIAAVLPQTPMMTKKKRINRIWGNFVRIQSMQWNFIYLQCVE